MDEKEKNKAWFDQLSDRLREHEEPYVAGSWEQFRSQHPQVLQPKRGRLIRMWIRYGAAGFAAAALVLAGLIFLWPDGTQPLVEVAVNEEAPPLEMPIAENPIAENSVAKTPTGQKPIEQYAIDQKPIEPEHDVNISADQKPRINKQGDLALAHLVSDLTLAEQIRADLRVADRAVPTEIAPKIAPKIASEEAQPWITGERLAALNGLPEENRMEARASDQSTRWNMGLVLAPNMTTEQINLGGGIAVAYRLNDKLSLQTGVSLGQYGVNTQSFIPSTHAAGPSAPMDSPKAPPGGDHLSSGTAGSTEFESLTPAYHTRYLNSQTSQLIGMDIPIELKYEVSQRFYTAVGLSVFGVLEENRTNHFVDRINEPLKVEGAQNSYSVRTLYVDERASRHPMDGQTYTGFLNFSVGHQTQISRRLRFSVE